MFDTPAAKTVQSPSHLPVKLEIAVKTEIADQVVEAITGAAQTGKIDDGKVFVYSLDSVVRIRTGDLGAEAL